MANRSWWSACLALGLLAPWTSAATDSSLKTPSLLLPLLDAPSMAFSVPFGQGADLPATPSVEPVLAASLERSANQPLFADAFSDQGDVYTLPAPPGPGEGSNQGGVNFDLSLSYYNHYLYRGVDHSIAGKAVAGVGSSTSSQKTKATSLNLQPDGRLIFDLGTFPHPFVGLFANVYDADPLSRFQEIRPFYGAIWTIRPFTLEGGGTTYIFPEREKLNTAEAYGKISLDDSFIFNTDRPIFSPYVYAAYDYDKNHGWYYEVGITHDIPLRDIGLTLTFNADLAYITGFQQQFVYINRRHDTGFQHFDVGMQAAYSLNRFFNISDRYGQFDLMGYLTYSGKLNHNLTANEVLWGGAGIRFSY